MGRAEMSSTPLHKRLISAWVRSALNSVSTKRTSAADDSAGSQAEGQGLGSAHGEASVISISRKRARPGKAVRYEGP